MGPCHWTGTSTFLVSLTVTATECLSAPETIADPRPSGLRQVSCQAALPSPPSPNVLLLNLSELSLTSRERDTPKEGDSSGTGPVAFLRPQAALSPCPRQESEVDVDQGALSHFFSQHGVDQK